MRRTVLIVDDHAGFRRAARALLGAEPNPPDVVLISSRDRSDLGPLLDRTPARGFITKADLTAEALERVLT